MTTKIMAIVGARPQFIKHAPIELAFKQHKKLALFTLHTGQHYDDKMSDVFFKELKLAKPNVTLNIGSHSHGKQTALMMISLEEIMLAEKPAAVLVYGDTNSTLAGALTAAKLNIPIIHIEAGLRSFNMAMPEEINRILTDRVSSLLFAPNEHAVQQLRSEGITAPVHVCGDVMLDILTIALKVISPTPGNYYLATIHRPYNTDDISRLMEIMKELNSLDFQVKFPVHPRTINKLQASGVSLDGYENIEFMEPKSYFEMISLLSGCQAVITDSGGVQKEAYWLKKKCITLRSETEWVETLENEWNTLVFEDLSILKDKIREKPGEHDEELYGDGKAGVEMVKIINEFLKQ